MRYLVVLFLLFILAVEVAFPVGAATTPEIDKIEALRQLGRGHPAGPVVA